MVGQQTDRQKTGQVMLTKNLEEPLLGTHSNCTIFTPFHSKFTAQMKITETLCVFSNIKQITWLVNKST